MTFLENMESRFSEEAKATEMYKLVASFGSYAESTIALEARALIDRNTDVSKMLASDVRKFLSYFYIPVRHFKAASGILRVHVLEASSSVSFGIGETLLSDNGSIYELTSSGIARQGEEIELSIRQSSPVTLSGIYDGYISFTSENVVLESITLSVNNQDIPRVTTPRNGFMSFYFNGKVYIKIYPGIDVPRLRGQSYSLTYLVSDGANGNVEANAFSTFSSQIVDANLKPISYELSNDAIENGASSPTLGELRDVLRYWLSTRNSLSKLSSYRLWYLTQPEVGDCLTWGDSEEFARNGPPLTLTGKIRVCLLSSAGGVVSAGVKADLNSRIQAVKDVAYLEYHDPGFTKHYFEIKYSSTLNDASFMEFALSELAARYDLPTLRANNMSLFDPLDVGALSLVIGRHSSDPIGLEIVPYYYEEHSFATEITSYSYSFPSPKNLKKGYTKYLHQTIVDGEVADEEEFTELMTSASTASVIRANGSSIGTHNYVSNTISLSATFAAGKIKVFGEALNRSVLDTGAFTKARQLGGSKFILVGEFEYA